MIFNSPDSNKKQTIIIVLAVLVIGIFLLMLPSGRKTPAALHVEKELALRGTAEPVAPKTPETVELEPPLKPPALYKPAIQGVEDIDFSAYSQDLANRTGLKLGESRLDAIDKMRLYVSPTAGATIVNSTSSTFDFDDGSVMLFAWNDMPDDSVFAEEVYVVFSGPGGTNKFNQVLAAFGLRVKCRRGDNAMEWTTELCP